MKKLPFIIIGAGAIVLLGVMLGLPLIMFGGLVGSPIQQSSQMAACANQPLTAPATVTLAAGGMTAGGVSLDASQVHYAELIIGVAENRHLSAREATIGVATAMQESSLSNPLVPVPSIGLFQQIPADGWGTAAQVSNPVYATNAFFNALVKQPDANNAKVPITVAAQNVQHSAYPNAYQQWASMATDLVDRAYVHKGLAVGNQAVLTSCNAVIASGPASAVARRAVKAALSQVGVPYVYGGASPGQGFDCSGLMQWAYAQAGVSIQRTANDQYVSTRLKIALTPASPANLRPGDLLFENWNEPGEGPGWGHVGMYIGGGKVIEAPHTGANVQVVSYGYFNPQAAARPVP